MSVYSIENLKEVMGDDPEFIAVVVQTFLDEIPPDLEGLKAAVAEGDRKRAYGFAHKMKPNIEMFGVDLMKNILLSVVKDVMMMTDDDVMNWHQAMHALYYF